MNNIDIKYARQLCKSYWENRYLINSNKPETIKIASKDINKVVDELLKINLPVLFFGRIPTMDKFDNKFHKTK